MTGHKLFTAALVGIAGALFFSCEGLSNFPWTSSEPPFAISGFEIKQGPVDQVCRTAGVSFYFINIGGKEISAFSVSFRLYDSKGTPIGVGNNQVTLNYSGKIVADEEKSVLISLDRFIPTETNNGIVADHRYVPSVTYSSGEKWKDDFGLWWF
jgi:hypothetical protein